MSTEGDPRLLSAEDLAAMREHWFSVGKQDPKSRGTELSKRGDFRALLFAHVDAQDGEIGRLTAVLGDLFAYTTRNTRKYVPIDVLLADEWVDLDDRIRAVLAASGGE